MSMVKARLGAYLRAGYLPGALLGQAPALPTNFRLGSRSTTVANTFLITNNRKLRT